MIDKILLKKDCSDGTVVHFGRESIFYWIALDKYPGREIYGVPRINFIKSKELCYVSYHNFSEDEGHKRVDSTAKTIFCSINSFLVGQVSFPNLKADSFCVGGRYPSAFTRKANDSTRQVMLLGQYVLNIGKKFLTVGGKTKAAKSLGTFSNWLGETSLEEDKVLTKNKSKNCGRRLDINASKCAAASRNLHLVLSALPDVINFHHKGRNNTPSKSSTFVTVSFGDPLISFGEPFDLPKGLKYPDTIYISNFGVLLGPRGTTPFSFAFHKLKGTIIRGASNRTIYKKKEESVKKTLTMNLEG